MGDTLPKFERPPVVETVLGVQFERLPEFSTAHAGWFWKSYLPPEFETVTDAPRLEEQFEKFGSDKVWVPLGSFRFRASKEPERVQISNSRGDRMLQIQDSRLVYNWRKQDIGYPSYDVLLPEFRIKLNQFREFAADAKLGTISMNQWEVTYVNQIPSGDLWTTPREWQRVIPGILAPSGPDFVEFEDFGGQWHFLLGRNSGRLHVTLHHGRIAPDGPEMMALNLTARGTVDAEHDWESGLNLGHDAIVQCFTAMTSPEAHRHWARIV